MARRRGVWAQVQRERERRRKAADRARRASVQAGLRAQREYEKRVRAQEREAAATERERTRLYVEDRKAEAAELTADVEEYVAELESVLIDGLEQTPSVSFRELKLAYEAPPFDSRGLSRALPPPRWEDFAPEPPSMVGRLTGGGAQYRRELDAKQAEYDEACDQHAATEAARERELNERRRAYRQMVAEQRRKHDAEVDAFATAVQARRQDAVEEFFKLVLDASPYPEGFLNLTRVIYLAHARDLVIEFELPPQQIIPVDHHYRYVQTRDELDRIARPQKEINERYAQLIAQVALRTVHEVLHADEFDVVDRVTFVGLVSTVDRATGKPVRPSLLSFGVDKERFAGLVLADVDPVACLRHLNALVSPHPYDLEPVTPIVDFEALLRQYKFVEGMDVIAGLDGRQDLLALTPTEFEHFTRQLFEKMGMKAWTTVASKDDGVDAVATSEAPVFGGLCVVQAKRYSRAVGIEAVRALAGTMEDKHATKGVMVTTSWVTRDGHAFAKRHGRIEIFEGGELKELCRQYLDLDVLISLPNPPPRRRT